VDPSLPAIAFFASGAVIVVAGSLLTRYADRISEITGIGRLWIGAVLLAAATSLPELTTGVAAVVFAAPDLAVGDLFGSSMANMLILALIDLAFPRARALDRAALGHALVACLAMSLNAMAAAFILAGWELLVAGQSVAAALLALGFVAGMRVVYRQEASSVQARPTTRDATPAGAASAGLRATLLRFAAAAAAIFAAAPVFAWSAEAIAEQTGLGTTFIGTWLLGLATSLPELVSSVAALRLGAYDLAVGNLFGSNAFNMAVFLPLDLAQPGVSIFAGLDPVHATTALFSVVLMSLGLASIIYRAERRFAMIEPSSLLMLGVYGMAFWIGWAGAAAP
jgi:cation:H+ antiporter